MPSNQNFSPNIDLQIHINKRLAINLLFIIVGKVEIHEDVK